VEYTTNGRTFVEQGKKMLATLKSKVSVRWWRRLWLPRDVNARRFTNSRDLYRVSKQNGFWIFREVAERKVKKRWAQTRQSPGIYPPIHRRRLSG
jgi:hypothetical protein